MAAAAATMATISINCTLKSRRNPTHPKTTIITAASSSKQKQQQLPSRDASRMIIVSKSIHHMISPTTLAGAFFAALSSWDHPAMAAQQVAEIAEGDNRGLALLLPIIPAIAWVLFNILQPALNQINKMRSDKAVMVGIGLAAAAASSSSSGYFLATPNADAAGEMVGEVAAAAAAASGGGGDSRGQLLLFVVLPAIAWVLFNILQPALNQLNRMRSDQ